MSEKVVLVGNRKLIRAFNVAIGHEVQEYILENEQIACSCVLVAVDGRIVGAFDLVKPEAGHVISFLHSMGISSIMVIKEKHVEQNEDNKKSAPTQDFIFH